MATITTSTSIIHLSSQAITAAIQLTKYCTPYANDDVMVAGYKQDPPLLTFPSLSLNRYTSEVHMFYCNNLAY
ncbi:hypothetical protein IEQ34_010033 [Dendrobium chrysotoxum]|uniref:Uncharacterized protein n=1 Tax=Dendrobium chrysotoxum TaxID=161865 RepID=A0AAV7H4L2_DENCH|nr:hypothetical protein IEQ34_010033 [Dendrobium chrysotoxum]